MPSQNSAQSAARYDFPRALAAFLDRDEVYRELQKVANNPLDLRQALLERAWALEPNDPADGSSLPGREAVVTDSSRSERESNVEYHDGEEQSVCIGQWCCGCDAHPIGKPWGWNYEAWARHRQDGCKAWPEDRAVERFPRGSIEREAAEDLLYGSPPEGRPGGIAKRNAAGA